MSYNAPSHTQTLANMRATEVLTQYAAGRRDFSGENLRGQSFKGKNLSGANFSRTDIRGANFSKATLIGANFSSAKAGLPNHLQILLMAALFIVSVLSGMVLGLVGILTSGLVDPIYLSSPLKDYSICPGIVVWITLASFLVLTIKRGYVSALVNVSVAVTTVVALFGIFVGTIEGNGTGATAMALAVFASGVVAVAIVLAEARAGVVVFGITITVAVTVIVIGFLAPFGNFEGSMDSAVKAVNSIKAKGMAGVVAGTMALLGGFVGWRALTGDQKDTWIRTIASAFAATGGTSFRHADLTDADFTSATLKSTYFRNATLTNTNFHQTKKLDLARVGNTILIDTKVRDLLVTHRGAKQAYTAVSAV
ncbi:MAG TPA: hypothetical protein DEG17_14490, partial [Cyanobacteria bacterium UBA11149]|nr:hypothetical protein [Cyanobacteria bacterium UBA11367]HBE59620.1 hypothetical protein [Cyanobacteria bacterium UBA11366]HBK64466.1 hypothetical protein [Cyanobacteria bacterium UBA11166]HBR75462.1 hypothetical protein [Cyanobacteria bacterium UBA11159]HBS69996.1 hypothetical protein [Cyanobacteria bacterium UBA11153]HBW90046.1 hypothetical protein [Cyanobacteria bacterium UBA11149]HCA94105.1 hypothetical protein [Cyanobacteria bacterium UBA9226]